MDSPLAHLPQSKPDPIFAITMEAKAAGPGAINATAGVFMDEDGKTLMFESVQKAIGDVSASFKDRTFSYPPLTGLPEFRGAVLKLLELDPARTASIATTGGTGAVAISLRLLTLIDTNMRIIVPSPTWANHWNLLRAANIEVIEVPHLKEGKATIDGIVDALKKTDGPLSVLLHAGCHNPTGLDLSRPQWEELLPILGERDCVPLLDCAYQGLAGEPEEDRFPVDECKRLGLDFLVAWSASKNHSIYSERAGLACAFLDDAEMKRNVEGHDMILTRGIHSAAATFGQSVVARVQEAYHTQWKSDLHMARSVLGKKRAALIEHLPARFHVSLRGNGMFACLPLTKEEVQTLKKDHQVFMTDDGRINIAGIPLRRIGEFTEKVTLVSGR